MSQLLDLRAAVVAYLKTLLPEPFGVEGHLGRFTAAELDKFLTRAPAVRVAVLGLTEPQDLSDGEGPVLHALARLAVYVVTKDGAGKLTRDESAIAAVEAIVLRALGQRWGQAFCLPARPASAQNLYSDETLRKGVALWAIDVPQPVRLSVDPTELPALSALWVGMAPKIGVPHVEDYLGPIPEGSDG